MKSFDIYTLIEKENLFGELDTNGTFGKWHFDTCRYGHGHVKVSSGYGRRGELFTLIPRDATEEEVRRKVQDLVKREIAAQKKAESAHAAREEANRKYKEQQQLLYKQWIGYVRAAFGGSPTERLPEDKQPKAISNSRLLSVCHQTKVEIPVPADQQTKAEFFRDLDALFHKHGVTW
jgi:hypothetical protein